MTDSTTPNYGFVQPEVGGSRDTWGDKLNDNWEAVDTALDGIQTELSSEATNIDNLQSLIADLRAGLKQFTVLLIGGNMPSISMEDANGPANARNILVRNNQGDLQFLATNDLGAANGDAITFERDASGFTSLGISDNGVVKTRISGQTSGTSFVNTGKFIVGAEAGPGDFYAEGDVYFAREATDNSLPWLSDNLRLRDTREFAANVGGSICFEGQYNSSAGYSVYGWVKGYKLDDTDGNSEGGLIIGSRLGPIYLNTRARGPSIDDPDAGNSVAILEDGRVGIGKVNPSSLLDVDGEIRGTLLDVDGEIRGTLLDVDGEIRGTRLDVDGEIRGTLLDVDGEIRGTRLDVDGEIRGTLLDVDGEIRGTLLDVDGEIRGTLTSLVDGDGDIRLTIRSNDAHNTSEIVPHDEDGTAIWGKTLTFYANQDIWAIQNGGTAYSANNKIMTQLDCDNDYHPKDDGEFADNTIAMNANGNKHLRFNNSSGQFQAVLYWNDADRSLKVGFYNPDGGSFDADYIMFQDGALSANEAVLTRAAGDARYLQIGDVSGFITQGQADERYLRRDVSNADVNVTFGTIKSSVSGDLAEFRAFSGNEARIYAQNNLAARFLSDGDFIAQKTARVVDKTVTSPNTLTPRSYIWATCLNLDGITPQDVTTGRNPQTWYTNGTGRPLLVHMDGISVSMQVRPVDGSIVDITSGSYTAMAVVPPGWQYRQSTATAIRNWVEYRA